MYKHFIRAIALLIITTALAGCKGELPKATQQGKNTFACKINGKAFVAESSKGLFGITPVFASYNRQGNQLYVRGSRLGTDKHENILFQIEEVKGVGVYALDYQPSYGQYEDTFLSPGKYYQTVRQYTGRLHLTKLDLKAGIIAGTFEFRAVNAIDSTDVVSLTHGRFDISTR
jgi:hypothetical protein